MALLALFTLLPAFASTSQVNLGRLTNDVPGQYFPLGGFSRVSIHMPHAARPLVLLMDTALDGKSAGIRWPLVKALEQFGTFSRVSAARQACDYSIVPTTIPPGHYGPELAEPCGPPTFDLSRASYSSPYVTFRERALIDQSGHVRVTALSSFERTLYARYARSSVSSNQEEDIWASVNGIQNSSSSHRLPLLLIGDYLQTVDQNINLGDFSVTYAPGSVSRSDNPVPYLTFGQTESALQRGREPSSTGKITYSGQLVHDVNADANIFVSLICHADRMKPAKSCNRSIIRSILRHVR